jgi:hypothetical protein
MGDPSRLAALCLVLLQVASGCAFVKLHWREPGHRNETFPDEVAEEYHCDMRPLPFFQFEKNELVPRRVKPGGEFNHRLVYVLCPETPTAVVPGTLHTRVLFEGKTIVEDTVAEKLRPGRWILDSFVSMPKDVEPGLYAMDVRFESAKGNLSARIDFVVKSP